MKIIEASEIPENEKVYLKKDLFGWRVVHPIKNEDGSFNWFNFVVGSWGNLLLLLFILLLIGIFFLAYHEIAIQAADCIEKLKPFSSIVSSQTIFSNISIGV